MASINSIEPMAAGPDSSFQKALKKFQDTLTDDQKQRFQGIKLQDVNFEIQNIQARFGSGKKLRNFNGISKFVEAMTQLEELVKVFLNVSEVVAFVWGPIKLALMMASTRIDTLDCLLDTYAELGEIIPSLKQYDMLFKNFPSVREVLSRYFYDVLEFHRKALDVFMRPAWETVWKSIWNTFRTEFKPILSSLKRHRDLLSDEKVTAAILEIQGVRQVAQDGFDDQSARIRSEFNNLSQQLNTLQETVYNSQNKSIENELAEEQKSFQRNKALIKEKLGPQVYDKAQNQALEQRFATSGDWILRNPKFITWVHASQPSSSTLYVHGIPGAGKTTIVSRIIAYFKSHQETFKSNILFFYFKHHESSEDSMAKMLRAILAQLVDQDSTLIEHFHQKLCSISTTELSNLQELKELAQESLQSQKRCIIILDGLDECGPGSENIITWFSNDLLPSCNAKGAQINLLFSGQRDGILDQYSAGCSSINLNSMESHRYDIEYYTKCRANKICDRFSHDEDFKSQIIEKVTRGSNGMFLYAKIVLDNLMSQGSLQELEDELTTENFPDGLERAYERVAIRVLERSTPRKRNAALTVLRLVTCAFRPLRWREIQSHFCIDVEKGICNPKNRRVDSCKTLCGSFVEAELSDLAETIESATTGAEMVIRLVHDTAGRYLVHTGHISLLQEHTKMAISSSRYLMSDPFKKYLQEDIRKFALSGYYGLLDYAAASWHHHVSEALDLAVKSSTDLSEDFHNLVTRLLENQKGAQEVGSQIPGPARNLGVQQLRHELQEWWGKGGKVFLKEEISTIRRTIENIYHEAAGDQAFEIFVSLAGVACFKCPRPQCDWFASGFADAKSRDRHAETHERRFKCPNYNCPAQLIGFSSQKTLEAHVKRSHIDNANTELLFPPAKRAEINIMRACYKGDIDAVKEFVHGGGDIKAEYPYRKKLWTPLGMAAEHGRIEICRYLVQNDAQIFKAGAAPVVSDPALVIAVMSEDYDLVCVLLEKIGATELNRGDKSGRSALCWAVELKSEAIIELLLGRADTDAESPKGSYAPLILAANAGFEMGVKLLLASGKVDVSSDSGRGACWQASLRGYAKIVKLILEAGKVDINGADSAGDTSLLLAIKHEHEMVVKLLLETSEVDVNARDGRGRTLLLLAMEQGSEIMTKLLLKSGRVNANARDSKNETALCYAVANGKENFVELLISSGKVDVNTENNHSRTPLMQAIEQENETITRLLLDSDRVDFDARNRNGVSPFSFAVSIAKENFVELLLSSGKVDVNTEDSKNRTPLMRAIERGSEAIIRLLLESDRVNINARNSNGETALWYAVANGKEHLVELLIASDKVNSFDVMDNTGDTPLILATQGGFEKVVKVLLATGKVDVNAKDMLGETPLHLAVAGGYEEVVRLLLASAEVDVNLCNASSVTPLSAAMKRGHYKVTKLLLESKKVDRELKECFGGKDHLLQAAKVGNRATVELLLRSDDVDVNMVSGVSGKTSLMLASERGDEEVVKLLLETEKVDVNMVDGFSGKTALILASEAGHEYVVQLLLETEKVDIYARGYDGKTSLRLARIHRHDAIVKLLVLATGESTKTEFKIWEDHESLLEAVRMGNQARVKLILAWGTVDINSKNGDGQTALWAALYSGSEAILRLLVERGGADVNALDLSGNWTPINWAVNKGNEMIVKVLLETGKVDVNVRDGKTGQMALLWAAQMGHETVVRMILQTNEADVNARDRDINWSPLMWAADGGFMAIVELLLEAGRVDFDQEDIFGETLLSYARENSSQGAVDHSKRAVWQKIVSAAEKRLERH